MSHATPCPTAGQVQGDWKTSASSSVLFLLIPARDTNLSISQEVNPHLAQSTHTYQPPWWLCGKESTCQFKRHTSSLWVEKIPWRKKWQPTPVFLPVKSHGQKTREGYSPGGSQSVRHDLATEFTGTHTYTKKHGRASMVSSFQPWPWEQAGSREVQSAAPVSLLLQSWFHLICFSLHFRPGEGNGTPLQYSSCLENPMDGGAW